MDFTAIDFETATSDYSSICSMGICVVENNKIVKTEEILIKPVPMEFNDYNIKIHGITPAMVKDAPTFAECWADIKPYLENKLIVAHNTSFDINALYTVLIQNKLDFPTFDYFCTVKLSQDAYPDFPSHKLNNLCASLGIEFSHHHAAEDAYACANVLLCIMRDYKLKNLNGLCDRFGLNVGRIYPDCRAPFAKKKKRRPAANTKRKVSTGPKTLATDKK